MDRTLRAAFDRELPFYRPGEPLRVMVRVASAKELGGDVLSLVVDLRRVADGTTVDEQRPSWQGSQRVEASAPSEPLEVHSVAPTVPGVYELRVRLLREPDRLWSRWRRPVTPAASFTMPLVVMTEPQQQNQVMENDSGAHSPAAEAGWVRTGEIRAADARGWSIGPWLPARSARLLTGSDPQVLANQEHRKHAGEVVAVIRPQQSLESKLPIQTAGRPHRVTLRLPAGQPRRLRVDLIDARTGEPTGQSFMLRDSAGRPAQAAWRHHTFVTYPASKGELLRLTNLDPSEPAMLESIRVEAGPLRLAEPQPGRIETQAGLAESTREMDSGGARRRLAALHLNSTDWMDRITTDIARDDGMSAFDVHSVAMHRAWVAAGRLADYLRALGFNGVVIPINEGAEPWYRSKVVKGGTPEGAEQRLETVLRLLDGTELSVLLRLEPSVPLSAVEAYLDENASHEAEVLRRSGRTSTGRTYNPFHPLVRTSVVEQVSEVASEFQRHRCVRGIVLAITADSHLLIDPESQLLDPVFADQFVQSRADLAMPVSQRRGWAQHEGRAALLDWMKQQTHSLYQELASATPDQTLLLIDDRDQGQAVGESAWSGLIDPPNLLPTGRLSLSATWLRPPVESLSRYLRRSESTIDTKTRNDRDGQRYAIRLGTVSDLTGGPFETLSHETLTDFSRHGDRLDPSLLLLDLPLSNGELSAELAEMVSGFVSLPMTPGMRRESHDPANRTVGLRLHREGNRMKLAISNRTPWGVETELQFSGQVSLSPVIHPGFPPNAILKATSKEKRVRVVIPAGRWTVMEADGAEIELTGWSARPEGGDETLQAIHDDVTAVFERLGTLTTLEDYPGLSNGGFEQAGDVGLTGWLMAQHPPEAVRVDLQEAYEGSRSIQMSNLSEESNRAWLVSETIPTPNSGRVAVSIACRAEASNSEFPHRLRIAVEGTDRDGPFKRAVDLEIPRNGEWQSRKVVLEVDGIDPLRVKKLRLTLDSLSSGRLWVDDIRFHDRFPMASERIDLRSQAFLAVQGLQRANLTAASHLLQNYWAKELLSGVDRTARSMGPSGTESDQESTGGMASRLFEWLPQSLRF